MGWLPQISSLLRIIGKLQSNMCYNGLITQVSPRQYRKSTFTPMFLRLHWTCLYQESRSTLSCTSPSLCGGSEGEGDGADGWCCSIPTHGPFQDHTRSCPCVPQGQGRIWGPYFVSVQILQFSSGSHPRDIKKLRKSLLGWPWCYVETV